MIRSAGLSDIGKVRESNQDAYLLDPERGLFILSDGMGGERAGDTASKIVVTILPELIRRRLDAARSPTRTDVKTVLRDAAVDLNRMVREQTKIQTAVAGMGATVVVLVIRLPLLYVANLGDSRAYRFRSGRLRQMTRDHTLACLLERSGEIASHELKDHAGRSVLTRYIGMSTDAYPDVRGFSLKPRDRLLLCSDGLTGMLADPEIAAVLQRQDSPEATCSALVAAANEAGGRDNVTCVVVDWLGS